MTDAEIEPVVQAHSLADHISSLFREMTLDLSQNEVLAEQELALSDLMDTSKAIEVGRFLAADYIVTGSVIEMTDTVVIFGRLSTCKPPRSPLWPRLSYRRMGTYENCSCRRMPDRGSLSSRG
jgi:hypothetical protein